MCLQQKGWTGSLPVSGAPVSLAASTQLHQRRREPRSPDRPTLMLCRTSPASSTKALVQELGTGLLSLVGETRTEVIHAHHLLQRAGAGPVKDSMRVPQPAVERWFSRPEPAWFGCPGRSSPTLVSILGSGLRAPRASPARKADVYPSSCVCQQMPPATNATPRVAQGPASPGSHLLTKPKAARADP